MKVTVMPVGITSSERMNLPPTGNRGLCWLWPTPSLYIVNMTPVDNSQPATANTAYRLRVDIFDALMARLGVTTISAQADRLHLNRSYWTQLRAGRKYPSLAVAMRVAREAGTTVEHLFEPES